MKWAIGLDVGGTKVAGALVDSTGKTAGFESSPMATGASQGVARVKEAAERLLDFRQGPEAARGRRRRGRSRRG